MYIEQLYTNCLAEAAYYLESEGQAAVVDPIRDIDVYLNLAQSRGASIKYIFETHFHADFVSGHVDLAKATGATIVYGPGAVAQFPIHNAADGEVFTLGKLSIKAIHTPGHTPESTCFLLSDENGQEHSIFTGDTLFVGDVGRPDLLDGVIISKEEQVANLYETIQHKIMPLADHLLVYPGHGPGSMCGKTIGKEKVSTIGAEKQSNYALQPMSKSEFASVLLDGQLPAPKYFVKNALINRHGYDPVEEVIARNNRGLNISEVKQEMAEGAIVLDSRDPDLFLEGFIPGAINVGLNGSYAIWVGTLVDIKQRLVIVADAGKEQEAILRLARVGIENIAGYLVGGFEAWKNAGEVVDHIPNMEAEAFAEQWQSHPVLDVRRAGEYADGHVPDAHLAPLRDLESYIGGLNANDTWLVHCAGGYRSVIACSILRRHGFNQIVNVKGGMGAIQKTSAPVVTETLA